VRKHAWSFVDRDTEHIFKCLESCSRPLITNMKILTYGHGLAACARRIRLNVKIVLRATVILIIILLSRWLTESTSLQTFIPSMIGSGNRLKHCTSKLFHMLLCGSNNLSITHKPVLLLITIVTWNCFPVGHSCCIVRLKFIFFNEQHAMYLFIPALHPVYTSSLRREAFWATSAEHSWYHLMIYFRAF